MDRKLNMSAIVDKIVSAIYSKQGAIGISVSLIVMLYMIFINQNNPVFSLIVGLSIAAIIVMIFSDIEQKSDSKKADTLNEEAILRKRKKQEEQELTDAKCISCNKPMGSTDEECPNCGFKRHKYTAETVNNEASS